MLFLPTSNHRQAIQAEPSQKIERRHLNERFVARVHSKTEWQVDCYTHDTLHKPSLVGRRGTLSRSLKIYLPQFSLIQKYRKHVGDEHSMS